MKYLITILLILSCAVSFSQVKIDSSGAMVATGNYPATKMRGVKAFMLSVQSITDRNNIPANFRDTGMVILVRDSSALYSLVGGIGNINWIKVGFGTGTNGTLFALAGTNTALDNVTGVLNGHTLTVDGGNTNSVIDPSASQENFNAGDGTAQANLTLFGTVAGARVLSQTTDGIGSSEMQLYANSDGGYNFYLNSNNGINEAEILGDAIADTIGYSTGSHIFRGNLVWKTPILGAANDSLLSIDSIGDIHYISKSSLPFSNQFLTAGYGILGFNYNGSTPQTWAVDTTLIANKTYVNAITGQDTAVWIVDSIACDTTGLLVNTDYLVCPTPVNGFAGHRNQIATKTGSVWNYKIPGNGDVLSDANPVSYYQYDSVNALWKLISRAVLVGYANYGGVLTIGTSTKNNIRLGTRNGTSIVIDTSQNVALPKFLHTRNGNYLGIDSATGIIDTFFFKPLIAGTNITISSSPQADTIKASGGGGSDSTTASNGLTLVGKDVRLGGSTNTFTTVNTTGGIVQFSSSAVGSPTIAISNSSSSVNSQAIQVSTGAEQGINIGTTTGTALTIQTSGGMPILASNSSSTTNTVLPLIQLNRTTTGTAANGIGQSIDFQNATTGSTRLSNQIISKWTNATDASRTSEFSIVGIGSAATNTLLTLSGSGAARLNKYGVGTFTGTPTFALNVDASGNVIEGTVGGGGGSTLTRQIITSGSSGTVTGSNYIVTIDPAATLASYVLTMPASPTDLQTVEVDFGGTLTNGTIVTALTISPNSGQTILDNTPPTTATADNTLLYRYRASNTTWYRFKP
jgi:hypothetical protein